MPQYEQHYKPEDFLQAMNKGLKTTAFLTRAVGCARKTTEVYLKILLAEGKIEKVEIDDGLNYVYQKVKTE